jgi:hypothetical protein
MTLDREAMNIAESQPPLSPTSLWNAQLPRHHQVGALAIRAAHHRNEIAGQKTTKKPKTGALGEVQRTTA